MTERVQCGASRSTVNDTRDTGWTIAGTQIEARESLADVGGEFFKPTSLQVRCSGHFPDSNVGRVALGVKAPSAPRTEIRQSRLGFQDQGRDLRVAMFYSPS